MEESSLQLQPGTTVKLGRETFTVGKEILPLRDSSAQLGAWPDLRARMDEDGYLFFRGLFDRDRVLAARRFVLAQIGERGFLRPGSSIEEGIASDANQSLALFRDLGIAHSPAILSIVDSPAIFGFFREFLGGEILTYDKRWLRVMARGAFNGWHYDSVFMNRGTHNLYTCWTPIGDIPVEQGPLVLALGSHRLERLKSTYGEIDVDRDHLDPIFTASTRELVDRWGCKLGTTHFQAGDVLIFGIYTMHASIPNSTDRYRISIDTRYQLRSEPVDDRFMGANGTWKGNYSYQNPAPRKPMEVMRAEWGIG